MLGRRSLKPELVALDSYPKLVRKRLENIFGEMANHADPNQLNPPPNPPQQGNRNPRPPPQRENDIPNVPNHNNQPLRQLFVPNAYEPSLAIDFTGLGNANFELKPSIMNLLPSFYGRTNESPLEHVTEFIEVCSTLGHLEASQEVIRLKLFPFTLKDKARSWFCNLAGGSITS